MKAELKNHLVWSPGRHRALLQCEKRYYYQYVASWGGWDKWASREAQLSYSLKRTKDFEIGRMVKQTIRSILIEAISGELKPMGERLKEALNVFIDYIHSDKKSSSSKNRYIDSNDKTGKQISHEAIHALIRHMVQVLKAFYDSGIAQLLINTPSLLIADFLGHDEFEIGHDLGVPSRIRPQAVWRKDGTICVAEWKCGVPAQSDRRLARILAAHVRAVMKVPDADNIRVFLHYLPDGTKTVYRFDGTDAEIIRKQLKEEFDLIRHFSDDPQINTAPRFRFRPHFGFHCNRCPYNSVCDDFSSFGSLNGKFRGGRQ